MRCICSVFVSEAHLCISSIAKLAPLQEFGRRHFTHPSVAKMLAKTSVEFTILSCYCVSHGVSTCFAKLFTSLSIEIHSYAFIAVICVLIVSKLLSIMSKEVLVALQVSIQHVKLSIYNFLVFLLVFFPILGSPNALLAEWVVRTSVCITQPMNF